MMKKTLLIFLMLMLLPITAQSANIYTQTAQGTYTTNVLFGSEWDDFTSMMTSSHSITQGADFTNLSLLQTFDAVWVDQELGGTLQSSEISTLQSYISFGNKVVLIGENNSWNAWNQSIMDIVGGGFVGNCDWSTGTPTSSNTIVGGITTVQNLCGSTLTTTGSPDILFSNDFAAIYSIGSGEALVILDSNWNDDSYMSNVDNSIFAANIVSWLGESGEPAPIPEPATMLLLGTGLVGLAGFQRKFWKKVA